MNRKNILCTWISNDALLVFFAVLLFSLPCSAAKIITVNPGEKIQSAIGKAKLGDTVLVFPGTYYENIALKRGINLKSKEGADVTILNGSTENGPVVKMSEDSTLDGFTITGRKFPGGGPKATGNGEHNTDGKGAVVCIKVSATVKNNTIRNNQTSGISISGENASPMISGNNIFLNKGSGIGCNHKSSATITENKIHENNFSGIGVQNVSTPLIVDNECYKNEMSGIGVHHKGTAPIIRSNRIYKNNFSGIGVELNGEPSIEDNNIYENLKAGIGIKDKSKASISGNVIQRNTLSGIGIQDFSEVNISSNVIEENILAGVTVMNLSKVSIFDNDINNGGTTGLVVNNSTVKVEKNRIFENTHHGISIHRGSHGEILENDIHNNGKDNKRGAGILIVSSNHLVLKKNTFSDNYGPGIYAHHCSPNIIENRFINDEILSKKHASPVVIRNVFYGRGKNGKQGKSGIASRGHSSPLIIGNKFLGRFGVGSYKGSNPIVIGNLFSGTDESSIETGRSGVKIVSEAKAIILNNRFLNGNRIFCKGLYIKENIKQSSYDDESLLSLAMNIIGLTKNAFNNKSKAVADAIKKASRKQRRVKARRALSGRARKLKGLVIQGNLFLAE